MEYKQYKQDLKNAKIQKIWNFLNNTATGRKPSLFFVLSFALVAALPFLFSPSPSHAGWSDPTDLPPGGNASAPLNVSSITQTKPGQIVVQAPTGSFSLEGLAPLGTIAPTPTIFGSAGIFGVGAKPAAGTLQQSAGVYGVAYEGSDNSGLLKVGLMGVAQSDTVNSVGVYGWDGTIKGTASSSYAGYYVGGLAVKGRLCFVDPDTGATVCKSSWDDVGGGSLFTESPANYTYLTNTASNLAVGGHDESDAAFFFDASSMVGTDKGILRANGGLVLGPPIAGATNNNVCEPSTETCGDSDCYKKQLSCPAGQVCKVDGSGCGVADYTAPSIPTSLVVHTGSLTANSLTLDWNASSDNNGGSGVKGYYIYRCQGAGCTNYAKLTNVAQQSTTYGDTGLSASTVYRYQASAVDNFGNESGKSAYLEITTQVGDVTPPGVPTGLAAAPVSSSEIDLTWNASSDNNGGTGVGGYHIFRCTGAGCSAMVQINDLQNPTVNGGKVTFANTGLASNTNYGYVVSAYDKSLPTANESGRSTPIVHGTTQTDVVVPNPPTNVSGNGTAYANIIPIIWTASTSPDVTKYYIDRCKGSGACTYTNIANVSAPTVSYDDQGVSANTTYTYKVRAFDGTNYSADSNTYTVLTSSSYHDADPPTVPTGLALKSGLASNLVPLVWNASTDVGGSGLKGYKVYRCQGGDANIMCATLRGDNGNSTTLNDTSVTSCTSYIYNVTAYDNNDNESDHSAQLLVSVPAKKGLTCDNPIPEGLSTPPNAHIASLKPVTTTVRPLARVFSSSLTASLQRTLLPVVQAAAPFGGNDNVRLTVNNGVIQILNKVGAVNTLEIGNNGSDIASTDVINIRPNGITTGTNYGIFSKNAKDKTDLSLGSLQLQGLSGAPATSPSNGTMYYNSTDNKFRCYQAGAWVDCVGGGSISGTPNYLAKFTNANSIGNSVIREDTGKIGIGFSGAANHILDVNGDVNVPGGAGKGFCINGSSCVTDWSNLILNTQAFTVGQQGGASFNIAGSGKIGTTLEVDNPVGLGGEEPQALSAQTGTLKYQLAIKGVNSGESGLRFTNGFNSGTTAGTSNGKALTVDASGNVVLVPAGGIGGSIADKQIAYGNSSGQITGSQNLTFDGGNIAVASDSGAYLGSIGPYQNLAARSEDFKTTPWGNFGSPVVTDDSGVSPDGSTGTADQIRFTSNSDRVKQDFALTASTDYTLSVWAKAAGPETFRFVASYGVLLYSPDQAVTTTWKRFSWKANNGSVGPPLYVGLADATAGGNHTVIFWGFQLEKSGTVGPYVRTTISAIPASQGVVSNGIPVTAISGGTQDYLTKFNASGNNVVSSAVIESGGSVGIGVTEPAYKLDVSSAGGGSANTSVITGGASIDSQWSNYARFAAGLKVDGGTVKYNTSNGNGVSAFRMGDGDISFDTGTSTGIGNAASLSQAATIKSSGNVGIGTSSPISSLQVAGDIVGNGGVVSMSLKKDILSNLAGTYSGTWNSSGSVTDGNISTYTEATAGKSGGSIDWTLDYNSGWDLQSNNGKFYVVIGGYWWPTDFGNGTWKVSIYNNSTSTWVAATGCDAIATYGTYSCTNPVTGDSGSPSYIANSGRLRLTNASLTGAYTRVSEFQVYAYNTAGWLNEGISGNRAQFGTVGIGTSGTPVGKLEVRGAGEQLRLSVDDNNRLSTTVSSTGGVTLDATGTGAGFTLSDATSIGGLLSLSNSGIDGGGLADCDNASTSKLLWDTTSKKFSCGADAGSNSANQQLSNLSGTVAVNLGLVPGATNNIDLGTSSINWKSLYLGSGGLTISGASTDITAGSSEALTLQGNAASTFSTTAGSITLQPAGSSTASTVQIGAGSGSTTPDLLGLDVKSSTGDPTTTVEGTMYYNTVDNKFRCYQGSGWTDCIGGSVGSYWGLSGNAIGSNDFIGGTSGNTNPFIVKTNGTEALRVLNGGKVGIGTSNPVATLQVGGDTISNSVISANLKKDILGNLASTYGGNWNVSGSVTDGDLHTYTEATPSKSGGTIDWTLDEDAGWNIQGDSGKFYILIGGYWWTTDFGKGTWKVSVYSAADSLWHDATGCASITSWGYLACTNTVSGTTSNLPNSTKLRLQNVSVDNGNGDPKYSRIAEFQIYAYNSIGWLNEAISGKRAHFDSVGVGTASPQGRVDLNTGSSTTDALFVKASGSVSGQGGIIHHQGSTYAWQEVAQNTSDVNDGRLTYNYVSRTDPTNTKYATDVLSLDSSGNVGVSNGAPNARLDIGGIYEPTGGLAIGLNLTTQLGAVQNGSKLIGARIAPSLNINGFSNVAAYGLLVESGTVGIGMTAPVRKVDINQADSGNDGLGVIASSSTKSALYAQQGGSGYALYASGGKNYFSGNVGIGTANPGAKLEIQYSAGSGFSEHIRTKGQAYQTYLGEYFKISDARSGTTLLSDASMNFGLDQDNDNANTRFAWFNNATKATDFSAASPLMALNEDGVAGLDVQAPLTAAVGSATTVYGTRLQQTLSASNNNDALNALSITPTFNLNGKSGTTANAVNIIASTSNSALYAQQDGSGYAGYFSGNVRTTGNLAAYSTAARANLLSAKLVASSDLSHSVGTGLSFASGSDFFTTTTPASNLLGEYISILCNDGDLSQSRTVVYNGGSSATKFYVDRVFTRNSGVSDCNVATHAQEAWPSVASFADYYGTTKLFVQGSTGYVGVNTYAPLYQLDVNGNARINGTLYSNGLSVTGTITRNGNPVPTIFYGGTDLINKGVTKSYTNVFSCSTYPAITVYRSLDGSSGWHDKGQGDDLGPSGFIGYYVTNVTNTGFDLVNDHYSQNYYFKWVAVCS